jgi:phage portal protein BeeE
MFGSRARKLQARVSELEAAAAAGPPPRPSTAVSLGGGLLGGGNWWTGADRTMAMSVPTLAYIRAQLAGGVASMPLERYRQTTDPVSGAPVTVKLPAGWADNPDPAPTIPPSLFWSWLIDDLFFYGQCTLVVLARDVDGWPVKFRRVIPGQVAYWPELLALGALYPTVLPYMGVEVPIEDQIVIPGPHAGICNYGAQQIAAAAALGANAAAAAAEPLPNIDLHQTGGEPMSPDAAKQLVTDWKAARQAGATAYTPSNLDAKPIGFSPADQQLIEARQYSATEMARLAGVNPTLVSAAMGSSSSYVYTNQADYRAAFLDDVLDAYLRAIEGRLSANDVTPRGQYLEFDRDAFTRLPLVERVQLMLGAMKGGTDPALVNQLAAVLDLELALPVGPADAPLPDPAVPNPTTAPPGPPAPAAITPGGPNA